jgi:hypothetical protein
MMIPLRVGGAHQTQSPETVSAAVASAASPLSVTRSSSTGVAGEVLVPVVQGPVEVVFEREVEQ